MKSVTVMFFAVLALSACNPNPSPDQQVSPEQRELIVRETLAQLKAAQEFARRDGKDYATVGRLSKEDQCTTTVTATRMQQPAQMRLFPEETKEPWQKGCVAGVQANARNARNERIAAQEAKRVAAAERTRLATATKKSAKKR